jgi:predicted  nucleic acid-binding Zn-ribbon protein
VNKADLLVRLQRVDTALDHARDRLQAIERQLEDRSAVTSIEAEHQAATSELHRLQAEQRDLELAVDGLRADLGRVEKKLYDGSVKIPKELASLVDEGQQIRGLISTREDRLLELYDELEVGGSAQAEAAARLATVQRELQARDAQLLEEQASLTSALKSQEQQRESLRAAADAATLRTYDSLRRSRAGVAVAEVAQQTCQGCRVSLPISLVQRARSSPDLVFCQSCGRILHAAQ